MLNAVGDRTLARGFQAGHPGRAERAREAFRRPPGLFEACTDHGMRVTGMPDPTEWQSIDRPVERCRQGLAELAGWYRANERMLGNVLADVNPSAPPSATPDPFERRMDAMIASLVEPWDVPRDRQSVLDAVVRHAIAFTTWRSLAAGRLSDGQIVGILTGLVQAVA